MWKNKEKENDSDFIYSETFLIKRSTGLAVSAKTGHETFNKAVGGKIPIRLSFIRNINCLLFKQFPI